MLVQHPVLLQVTIPRFLFGKPIPLLVHDFHEVDTMNLSPGDMLVTQLWPIGMPHSSGWFLTKDGLPCYFRAFSESVEKPSGIASEAAGHRLGKPK